MKILFIKPGLIFENTGGGIEAQKIYFSLKNISKNNQAINFMTVSSDHKLDFSLNYQIKKSKIKDVLARMFLHSSFTIVDWGLLGLKKVVLDMNPDIVILGNSRLGFIAKDIKKRDRNVRVIGHFDNVEFDYVDGAFLKKGIRNAIRYIEKLAVMRDEREFLKNTDINLFLSKRDKLRAEEIYGIKIDNAEILPVCIERSDVLLKDSTDHDINVVFVGSLWYESNISAIKWFLENVWELLLSKYPNSRFIIGGSNPSKNFLDYIRRFKNISVFPNFSSFEEIIPRNSVFVSPIQIGAGMKVKVAEALSMGLAVVGSYESLIGYEEALEDDLNRGVIYHAINPTDYINAIQKIIESRAFDEISQYAKMLYQKYYSIDRAINQFYSIIDKIQNLKDETQ